MNWEKFNAYLATGRVSNLPTIWCQVYTAFILTGLYKQNGCIVNDIMSFNTVQVLVTLSFLISCLYVGGCFLGDAFDRNYDALHKPDRPIPSGLISANTVFILGWILVITSLVAITVFISFIYQQSISVIIESNKEYISSAILLTICIVAYAKIHKKRPRLGLFLMASCRGLAIILSAYLGLFLLTIYSALPTQKNITPLFFLYPLSAFLFTMAFAKVAQLEHDSSPVKRFWYLPYVLGPALSQGLHLHDPEIHAFQFLPFATLLIWLSLFCLKHIPKNKGLFVGNSIAGFCLVDASFIIFQHWLYVIPCFILFGITLMAQRCSPAT